MQVAAENFARRTRALGPRGAATVERYAREIVPAFNAYLYFRVGYLLGRWIARSLYRVRLGYSTPKAAKTSRRTRPSCS